MKWLIALALGLSAPTADIVAQEVRAELVFGQDDRPLHEAVGSAARA